MNGFGSFMAGWNAEADREQNRRLRMMEFFDAWRQRNPHATADEMNKAVENLTGGANYWLRGSLPSQQQINQFAAENARNKTLDDVRRGAEMARGKVQTRDNVLSIFDEIVVQEPNPLAAMENLYSTLGAQDEKQKAEINALVGDPSARRQQVLEKIERENRDDFFKEAQYMQSLNIPYKSSKAFQQLPKEVQESLSQQYERKQETEGIILQERRSKLMGGISSDPTLLNAMVNGQYSGNDEMLDKTIRSRLAGLNLDRDVEDEHVRRVRQELKTNSDAIKQQSVVDSREGARPLLEAQYDQMVSTQKQFLAGATAGVPDNVKAGLMMYMSGKELTDSQMQTLPGALAAIADEHGDEPSGVILEKLEQYLGPATPMQNKELWMRSRAQELYPEPMTEQAFSKAAMGNITKISEGVDKTVEQARKSIRESMGSSDSHRRDTMRQARMSFGRLRDMLNGQLEDITSTVQNPKEQGGPSWSPGAGRDAISAIQAELKRLELFEKELLEGPEFQGGPELNAGPPASERRPLEGPPEPPAPMGARGRRGVEPIGVDDIMERYRPQQGPVDIKSRSGRPINPSPEIPNTPEARAIGNAIETTAQKYGLPPEAKALMYAIVETESSFNPQARNKSGALGAAQFMPETARDYGLSDPTDLAASVDATARKLIDAYKRQGNWFDAAVAHHSGNAWSNLGPAGRDYAEKLFNRYQKYLNA
jgi:hypothetical protein